MITRLRPKNQVTIPSQIVNGMNLKLDQLFEVSIDGHTIKLTPVEIEPTHLRRERK